MRVMCDGYVFNVKVKETRKAVRDSETAVQKMSVSHQIGQLIVFSAD